MRPLGAFSAKWRAEAARRNRGIDRITRGAELPRGGNRDAG